MREEGKPLVSVVMLSYNRPQYLEKALDSILNQSYRALEIIVVDNPSPNSHSIKAIVERHSQIQLIAMTHNSGYTGGMNEGILRAKGDYIYLTEDDMVTERCAIGALVDYMEQDEQAGIVSGVLYDDNDAMICGGGFVRLDSVFSQFLFGRNTPEPPTLGGPFCVSFATGAMMFLRRRVIEELGAFRPDFFMYYEDVELCQRVTRSGRTIVIVPSAQARTFKESYKEPTTREVDFHKMKNFFTVYLLHAEARKLPEFLVRYGAITLLREAVENRKAAWLRLKAEWWTALNLPKLLAERKRLNSAGTGAKGTLNAAR